MPISLGKSSAKGSGGGEEQKLNEFSLIAGLSSFCWSVTRGLQVFRKGTTVFTQAQSEQVLVSSHNRSNTFPSS